MSKDNTKGFTIVEMAIILIVIGIIMSIAIKGHSILEISRTKTELAKIVTIQSALASYLERYARIPGDEFTGQRQERITVHHSPNAIKALIAAGDVQLSDFFVLRAPQPLTWTFIGCHPTANGFIPDILGDMLLGDDVMDSICITMSEQTDPFQSSHKSVEKPSFMRLACAFENNMDDKRYYSGKGRYDDVLKWNHITGLAEKNCFTPSLNNMKQTSYLIKMW